MRAALLSIALIFGSHAAFGAEQPPEPGQLASVVLPAVDALPAISVLPVSQSIAPADRHDRTMHRLWIVSMASMAAASSADLATSWGKAEGNALLASSNGTFGMRGAGIKAGIALGAIVPQLLLRRHKGLQTGFIVGNFAQAGIYAGIAIHNSGIAAPAGN